MDAERILVVDDDEAFLMVMATHLQRRGLAVEVAHNGREGLTLLRERGPFAVLISDLTMPFMDGIQLTRAALQHDPFIEVIVITATGGVENAISAMREDGAFDYLLKPLEDINFLSVAANRALAHRRLRLEREALQNHLASEAERLTALVASVGDAIIAADAQNHLFLANPAAVRLFGPGAMAGVSAMTVLPPPLLAILADWFTGETQKPVTIELHWPPDTTHMISLAPLAHSKQGGWVMTLRDITHFKRFDELKMRLLGETATKLRFPLAQAITDLAELKEAAEAQGPRFAEAHFRLIRLWGRIRMWADDLLSIVRIESGVGIQPVDLDLSQLLLGLRPTLEEGFVQRKLLQLHISVPTIPVPIRADHDLVRHLTSSLTSWAGGRSERRGHLQLTLTQRNDQAWIAMTDDGPRIAEADLPHLFDRSPTDFSSGAETTGLELVKVKSIADRLGGQVWAASLEPKGCTISVSLPLHAPRPFA